MTTPTLDARFEPTSLIPASPRTRLSDLPPGTLVYVGEGTLAFMCPEGGGGVVEIHLPVGGGCQITTHPGREADRLRVMAGTTGTLTLTFASK